MLYGTSTKLAGRAAGRPLVIKSKVDINIDEVMYVAREAGCRILEVYGQKELFVEHKEDSSPLTLADKVSHELIASKLRSLYPEIPILSEEDVVPYEARKGWEYFWLVDPLDGTKEFIKRNGEFTVNMALIRGDRPIFGVIYAPARDELFYAMKGEGAYKIDAGGKRLRIVPAGILKDTLMVVASRSHKTKELEDYMAHLKTICKAIEYVSSGSSLKFCLVAEGKAHIYPRLGPTMEWDTAAGQIIVEEAGGAVVDAATGEPVRYNREFLVNASFLVGAPTFFKREGSYAIEE
jgi:3'(2'), 5'-bisphosphate nucleotidase